MFWGCVAIIAGHYGVGLYPRIGLLIFFQHYFGPWITLYGSYILWKHASIWRGMDQARDQVGVPLTRDPYQSMPPAGGRARSLERAAKFMMGTAAMSLVYWFDLPEPELILLAALLVWFFKRFVFRVLRRQ